MRPSTTKELVRLGAAVERAMLAVQLLEGDDAERAGVADKVGVAYAEPRAVQERLALEIGLRMMADERGPTP